MSGRGKNPPDRIPGKATIKSLSPEGCNVALDGVTLSADQRVLLGPKNGRRIPGCVRWVVDGHAGIEFDEPLSGEEVENYRTNIQLRQSLEIAAV